MKKTKGKQSEIVYGIHPIVELLKAKKRKLVALYTTKKLPRNSQFIQEYRVPEHVTIHYVEPSFLTRLAGTTDHQGMVGLTTPFIFKKSFFDSNKFPFLLLLDRIQDPRNLGAIIRSAYCAGVNGIIIPQKGSAPLTPAALKASAGLAEHMDIYHAPTAYWAAQELKKEGYHLYMGVLSEKAVDATKVPFTFPLAMVIGNEALGIAKELARLGTAVTLPQRSSDVSYNASVAAGILLFLATQQGHYI